MRNEKLPFVVKNDPKNEFQNVDLSYENANNDTNPKEPLFSRWQSFCGICLYVSVAGTTYAFAIYSQLLKNDLGYSQSALDMIASIGTTGLYLSLIAGFAIEKIGFRSVVFYGGLFIFIGFMYIYLAIIEKVPADIYSISFFYFLSQAGVCCHITSAVTVAVKLFPPESRGLAIGLSKGYFGLSTAVLGDLAGGYFEKTPSLFLVFIAVFIPIVGFLGSHMANILPSHLVSFDYERSRNIPTSLTYVMYHWLLLFLSLLVLGYVEYMFSLSDWIVSLLSALLMALVFSILLLPDLYGDRILPAEDCVAMAVEYNASKSFRRNVGQSTFNTFANNSSIKISSDISPHSGGYLSDSSGPIYDDEDGFYAGSDTDELLGKDSHAVRAIIAEHHDRMAEKTNKAVAAAESGTGGGCYYGESLALSESIKTWRMWMLFFCFMVTCGSGLMVIYNVNAIAQAVNKSPSSFFVTLISLANGMGRVSAGLISDHIIRYAHMSKLQLLGLVVGLMSVSQLLLSFGSPWLIFPCFLSVGFLFGCNVSLMAVNVADIFGEKYIATNFGLIDTSPILGSYVFATFSIALFYQDNTTVNGEASCLGPSCFRTSFLLNATSTAIAALMVYFLHVKTPRS